jgi:hypothetical protein
METQHDAAPPRGWSVWIETLVITLIPPLLGHFLAGGDPFFAQARFPWLVLSPLLLGLRHGPGPGVTSAALLAGAMLLAHRWSWTLSREVSAQPILALLVVGLVAGEFSGMWGRRQRRLSGALDYQRRLLAEYTRTYQVVKSSHDLLLSRLETNHPSLRDALGAVRRRLGDLGRGDAPFGGAADTILELLAEFGQIQVAALFAVEGGVLRQPAVAQLGAGPPIAANDPMIAAALATRSLASIGLELRGRETRTQLLAALPLCDVSGRVWGLVAVREMLFVAFESDTLKLLAVVAGHLGDMLALHGQVSNRERFQREVRRGLADVRVHGLPCSLVRLAGPPDEAMASLCRDVVAQCRVLDRALVLEEAAARALLLFLPLTDSAGVLRVRERIEGLAAAHFGGTLPDSLRIEVRVVNGETGEAALIGAPLESLAA